MEIFLRSQGYQVFQAENGLEGLKILEERPIDLAIVDVMMPGNGRYHHDCKAAGKIRLSGDLPFSEDRGGWIRSWD